mmetsp:Transcript_46934/g.148913  ORF Transcript_46934/g.148913 Transcript_46934/m.148913 type:complete len:317 (+) Transcript_46934:143-1093(+)
MHTQTCSRSSVLAVTAEMAWSPLGTLPASDIWSAPTTRSETAARSTWASPHRSSRWVSASSTRSRRPCPPPSSSTRCSASASGRRCERRLARCSRARAPSRTLSPSTCRRAGTWTRARQRLEAELNCGRRSSSRSLRPSAVRRPLTARRTFWVRCSCRRRWARRTGCCHKRPGEVARSCGWFRLPVWAVRHRGRAREAWRGGGREPAHRPRAVHRAPHGARGCHLRLLVQVRHEDRRAERRARAAALVSARLAPRAPVRAGRAVRARGRRDGARHLQPAGCGCVGQTSAHWRRFVHTNERRVESSSCVCGAEGRAV